MNNLKQKINAFIAKHDEAIGSSLFCLVFVVFLGLGMLNQPSQQQKDYENLKLVAYNEKSTHVVGNENYDQNPLHWFSIVILNQYSSIYHPNSLKYQYLHDIRAVSLTYKLEDDFKVGDVQLRSYEKEFQFDDSGTNSIIHENGWTTERYNLVAIK